MKLKKFICVLRLTFRSYNIGIELSEMLFMILNVCALSLVDKKSKTKIELELEILVIRSGLCSFVMVTSVVHFYHGN